jgi:hypothetical protein
MSVLILCLAISFLCAKEVTGPSLAMGAGNLPEIQVEKNATTFTTANGKPFVPFGVTYYRPNTGWAPQVWTQFDPEATRQDFALMKRLGVNCVRVFLSYHSFYSQPGVLNPEGLEKFDQFLAIAEAAGIYVQPTGPDTWEGWPTNQPVAIEDENAIRDLEQFWKLFAARYRGRSVIFAYELKNEPSVPWRSDILRKRWNIWLEQKYASAQALTDAWKTTQPLQLGQIPIPPATNALNSLRLLDYQSFRESIADEWTRRQVLAIKSADPNALVTVGLVQWSVPIELPVSISQYSAFCPARQARFLDFLEIHFYPLAQGVFDYRSDAAETRNLAYLESLVRAVAQTGKPTLLGEFGWYGGGRPHFDGDGHPAATQAEQARYCRRVVETSSGFVCGWFNWGLYDDPEATDVSELTGLLTATGQVKAWGNTFQELAKSFQGKQVSPPTNAPRPKLNRDACVTDTRAALKFQRAYYQAFFIDDRHQEDAP